MTLKVTGSILKALTTTPLNDFERIANIKIENWLAKTIEDYEISVALKDEPEKTKALLLQGARELLSRIKS